MYSARDTACAVGCPIRKSPDQSLLTAPRSLSQCATSFIASMRQGIHQMPLGHLRTPPCPEIRPDNPVKPQNTAVSDIKDQQKAKSLPSISDVKKPIHNVKEQSSFQPERQTRSIDDHPQPRLRRQNGGANRGQRGNPGDRRNQPDWWSQSGSNRRPQACKASALPTELWPLVDTCSQNTPAPLDLESGPGRSRQRTIQQNTTQAHHASGASMVGLGGLEPPTSRLSGVRSNHLSYRPDNLQGQANLT
jgi:hypothetical protein